MKKIKFLHCADVHLDAPFASLGTENGRSAARRQELKETLSKIIDVSKARNADLLLISGDLYEHGYIRKSAISFLNDRFSEISDTQVFIVPGNHDPNIRNSYYKNYNWSSNVHILTDSNPYVILEDMGACIYGAGFNNFIEEKTLLKGFEPVNPFYFNILLVHGTVDMNIGQCIYNPMTSEHLASLGMDYIALGHFHNRIDDIGSTGIVYNPGSPEPLGFDEPGEHGVFFGYAAINGNGDKTLDIEFLKLNKRSYKNMHLNVDGCCNDEQIKDRIRSLMENDADNNDICSITLKGYVECGFNIDIPLIRAFFNDSCFYLKIIDETSPDYDFDEIMNEPGLRGLFTRKMYALINKAGDGNEKNRLMKALYFGLEALEQGKVEIN